MPAPLRVLILEDSPTEAGLMVHHLRDAGYEPDWRRVETEPDYLSHLDPSLDSSSSTTPCLTLRGPARSSACATVAGTFPQLS